MKENGSDLEEIIREELHKEAEDIRETVESLEGESLYWAFAAGCRR